MVEIYVPIEYSEVKNIIPSGEEILYSTLCKITEGSESRAIIAIMWISHMLLTDGGVAFTIAQKKVPALLKYIPWTRVTFNFFQIKKGGGFNIDIGDKYPSRMFHHIVGCQLIRDPNFETKKKFQERKLRFPTIFMPLLIQKKEEFLQSSHISRLTPKQRSYFETSLKVQHKLYNKMKKKMSK